MPSTLRLAALVVTVLAASRTAGAQTLLPRPEPNLRVAGTGEVKVLPDQAIVRLGVSAEGKDAKRAQALAAERMAKVTQAIRGRGIAAERITTERLDLQPVWEQDPDDRRSRVVAYRATNVVRVEVRLGTPPAGARAGEVVDAAIAAGANELQGIEFTLRDEEPARLRAMALASERARARAEALAKSLGVPLGRLLEASSDSASIPPPMPFLAARMKLESSAPTPVEPGELTIQATVNVTYAIGQPGGKAP